MATVTGESMGTFIPDNLIAKSWPEAMCRVFTLGEAAQAEAIPRGTVLSRESDGTYVPLGTGSGTASCVAARTTEAGDEVIEAYLSGNFYRSRLLPEDYELTEEDENNLRLAGILLSDGI